VVALPDLSRDAEVLVESFRVGSDSVVRVSIFFEESPAVGAAEFISLKARASDRGRGGAARSRKFRCGRSDGFVGMTS
jgi:hypothetical protein